MQRLENGLNDKQERFCQEYLVDLNGTQAAIRSGYSPETANEQASRLLAHAKVQARVAELQSKLAKKLEVTQERILREYALLGFSSLGDFMRVQPDGTAYFDLSGMTKEQAATILEYQVDEYTEGKKGGKGNGKGESGREVKRMKIKLHDKKGALDSMAKHLGMFVEKVEARVTTESTEAAVLADALTPEELEVVRQRLAAKAK